MGNGKHTPGPWDYTEGRTLLHVQTAYTGEPGFAGRAVCSVPKSNEANARLIAAAPDLEQAAVDAEAGIREAVRIMDLMGRGQDARNLAIYGNNLRAALAKAGA